MCRLVEPGGDVVWVGQASIVVGFLQAKFLGQSGHWLSEVNPLASEYVPVGQGTTCPSG
jgi:hypothetical protein